jgi:carbon-monoxide dehydrogenase large subunit
MTKFGIAQSVSRVEDQRLITGRGRYTDDIVLPNQLQGYMLRSPYAHARITNIDTAAAKTMPGVAGVYTVADLRAAGIGDLPCNIPMKGRPETPRPALAEGEVRLVGDPVAFVVAETLAEARDAAEAIVVDYEELPAVTGIKAAMAPGAPLVWPGSPGNIAFRWEMGDAAKTEALFASAAHVTRLEVINNRVVVASMEGRAVNAGFDAATGRFTLYTGSQSAHLLKNMFAGMIFKVPVEKFQVITPDVGGGFGMKFFTYPEQVMCLFAARAIGRPVKWTGDRSEGFLSDTQGRDNVTVGEIAIDKDGKFLAIRSHNIADMGAYFSNFAPMIPTSAGSRVLGHVYGFQAAHVRVEGVFTNSVPVDAYRGAGRPEANYLVERLVEAAAAELGIDRVELRRRNMVPPEAMPWTNATGATYDSGKFVAVMDRALEIADWNGFPARRAAAKARGKLAGIGIGYYLEATAGGAGERAEIKFQPDGFVDVLVGTQSTGQGHETAYTQLIVEQLGIPFEKIRVVQGDSDVVLRGAGTGGAKSLYTEGAAIIGAGEKVVENGKQAAGDELEASAVDIEFKAGTFRIAGTDRSIGIMELADRIRAKDASALSQLNGAFDAPNTTSTFPNGCHICEVEIDEATGTPQVVRYTVVDDFGKIVNPKIAKGQVHGGIAQGIGQALYEEVVWGETGQPLTASFTDYCMPRADNLPDFDIELFEDAPCTTNLLGVKGAGEAGSVGSCPAAINAVIDALRPRGIAHVDMPATQHKLWRLLNA